MVWPHFLHRPFTGQRGNQIFTGIYSQNRTCKKQGSLLLCEAGSSSFYAKA